MPTRVNRRTRKGHHTTTTRAAGRPRLLRLPRRRSVPQPNDRPPRLRRNTRAHRRHIHQQNRDHQQHLQHRPRPPRRPLPTPPPRGQILSPRRQRQPLQSQTNDPHRTRRTKRHHHPPHSDNHSHQLPHNKTKQNPHATPDNHEDTPQETETL